MAARERLATDETLRGVLGAVERVAQAINRDSGNIYGFHIDGAESDPAAKVTYLKDAQGLTPAKMNYTTGVFDYGSWEDAFFMPRPCMLKSDGNVDYYLDPSNYAKKEDGSASDVADINYGGNAMMEWGQNCKKIWMKIQPDSNHLGASVFIADYQVDATYHDWSFHNCQGVSVDHFYTPIFNGAKDSNNKLRSISGQQVSNKATANQEIAYARANNPGSNVLWDIEHYSDITLINMLLILMAKTVDLPTAFGQGLRDSGSEAINNAFRTGVHNTKGLFYGTNSGAAATYSNAVKVFGMENWWGFQWRRYVGHVLVDGVHKVKNTFLTEDGSTATDYVVNGEPTGAGFKSISATVLSGTSGNYIKYEWFDDDGMVPCGELTGSDTTYYCDGCWYNNSGVRVPYRGGSSYNGAKVGAFSLALLDPASYSAWNIGAAVSCKPLA